MTHDEKYKICPACGKKNYPGLVECVDCEQDLTHVRITDDETERAALKADHTPMVRICDNCHSKNPSNARKCGVCGEDIADITPTPDSAPVIAAGYVRGVNTEELSDTPSVLQKAVDTPPTVTAAPTPVALDKGHDGSGDTPTATVSSPETPVESPVSTVSSPETPLQTPGAPTDAALNPAAVGDGEVIPADRPTVINDAVHKSSVTVRLTSLDRSYTLELSEGVTLLGRSETGGEYLATKPYVSRTHCSITVSEEGALLEELSNTNYTFVNNQRVMGKVLLKNGDMLSLGGLTVGGNRQVHAAYFTVTVV